MDLSHGAGRALPKTNRTHKSRFRFFLLDTYLFVSSLGTLREIWKSIEKKDYITIYLVIIALILIIIGYIYVYGKLLTVSKRVKEDKRIAEYVNNVHFLCGDKNCGRCWGYFLSFPLIFVSIFTNSFGWYSLVIKLDPTKVIIFAIPLFLFSTPIPAFIGRIYPDSKIIKMLDKFFIKFSLGIVTGISLGLIGGYLVYAANVYPKV